MADGLGMDEDEWAELAAMVDDSFWVMRVIGGWGMGDGGWAVLHGVDAGGEQDTRRCRREHLASVAAHTKVSSPRHGMESRIEDMRALADYGCLTCV